MAIASDISGNETERTKHLEKKVSITGGYLLNDSPSQRSLIMFVLLLTFDEILMERIVFLFSLSFH